MFPIQPRRRRQGNEELTAVGVGPGICHAQHARTRMFEVGMDLVSEFLAEDGAATATGTGGIAGLDHEIRDDAMDEDVVVVAPGGEGGEILAGLEGWSASGEDLEGIVAGVGEMRGEAHFRSMFIVELDGDGALHNQY